MTTFEETCDRIRLSLVIGDAMRQAKAAACGVPTLPNPYDPATSDGKLWEQVYISARCEFVAFKAAYRVELFKKGE